MLPEACIPDSTLVKVEVPQQEGQGQAESTDQGCKQPVRQFLVVVTKPACRGNVAQHVHKVTDNCCNVTRPNVQIARSDEGVDQQHLECLLGLRRLNTLPCARRHCLHDEHNQPVPEEASSHQQPGQVTQSHKPLPVWRYILANVVS